jgi:signal transduction histidine kinase
MDSAASAPDVTADVLVVDDVEENRLAIEVVLESTNHHVVPAASGEEALVRLLEQDFAVVLLDVQMPGMDGYETAKLIRSRERTRHTPIIFMTAHSASEAAVHRAYELGAVDFMFKPLDSAVLRAKVAFFLELQQLRAAQERAHEQALQAQRRDLEAFALERALETMRTAERHKDEFLAILGHELRNPLASLRMAVELMRDERRDRSSVVDACDRQISHLTRLVDDLLDVARLNAGKISLHKEIVSLSDIVTDAIEATRVPVEAKQHVLRVTPPMAVPYVEGDAVRLVQVVANLVSNAAKYTPPGGTIAVAWGVRDDRAFLSVSDNGRGIAPEVLERVFDLFVQERAGSDGDGGLGIGLALVRQLVELHGGTVDARSEGVGRGSTFEIELPAVAAAPRAVTAPAPSRVTHGLRVLVVDDQEDIRDLVADVLRDRGCEVCVAGDGAAAIEILRAKPLDAALVDIGLPDMDGYAVAASCRASGARDVRLVAMTGYGHESDRMRALSAGFDVHVVKPASADVIMAALLGQDAPRRNVG